LWRQESAIEVTIGGKTVEVCCNECAEKLNETHSSSRQTQSMEAKKTSAARHAVETSSGRISYTEQGSRRRE
jgi:hypothetical protein